MNADDLSDCHQPKVLALTGGVGGAKLALGLSQLLADEQLSFIVNTADDFTHCGLPISPDIDTLVYTLAGLSHPQQGWGLAGESWNMMAALKQLNGPDWFQLGDKDLAMHVMRLAYLTEGKSLTEACSLLAGALNVNYPILPMCNESVSTMMNTDQGRLCFQDYFVAKQCSPAVRSVEFEQAENASLSAEASAAIESAAAIIICPSNPFLSIAPILAVPGLQAALIERQVPVVVVSPIVANHSVKGPTAKMMQEFDMPVSSLSIAEYYQKNYPNLVTHFVLDTSDAAFEESISDLGFQVHSSKTLMHNLEDKTQLASQILSWLKVAY